MKRLLLFAILIMLISAVAFGMKAEVAALKSALGSGNANKINHALVQLNMAIQEQEEGDKTSWNTPSSMPIQRRQEVQNVLESIKSDLTGLIPGNNKTISRNATVILGFTSGGDEVYRALKLALENSTSASVTASAFYALYQLDAADGRVREIALGRIRAYEDRSQADVAFGLLSLPAVWSLSEVLPVCMEILKSDTLLSNKVVAATAIMKFGSAGKEALPELKKLLQDLKQQGGDFRYIHTVQRAIRLVGEERSAQEAMVP